MRGGHFTGWTTRPIVEERVLLSASEVRGFPLLVASGATRKRCSRRARRGVDARLRTLLVSVAMLALIALATWASRGASGPCSATRSASAR